MTSEPTAVARLQAADDALASAQTILDKARSGLQNAGKAAERVDDAKRHPMRWIVGLLLVAVGMAFVIRLFAQDD